MRVALDIGHQLIGDRGAVSARGLSENQYWTDNIRTIVDALASQGQATAVKIFRRDDYGNSVSRECEAINKWGAGLAVSLHLNSADSPTATGHEAIHYPGSKQGIILARLINEQVASLNILRNRGIKEPYEGRGNTWLSKTICPAIILEAGFLSNPSDEDILLYYAARISSAIAAGITQYISACAC